jgi:hypothetical protein
MMMAAAAGLIAYVGGMWFMFYHVQTHLRRTKGFGECPFGTITVIAPHPAANTSCCTAVLQLVNNPH